MGTKQSFEAAFFCLYFASSYCVDEPLLPDEQAYLEPVTEDRTTVVAELPVPWVYMQSRSDGSPCGLQLAISEHVSGQP